MTSAIPLYHRIFSVLRQRIVVGTYATGDRLAPEDELAAEFGVSRATVRQAVGELVNIGFVSREQGRGTFVLPVSQRSIGPVFRGSLDDLIAETHRAKMGSIEVTHDVEVPAQIAAQLGLDPPVGTAIRRTRLVDGAPFGYTVNHLPARYGRRLTRTKLARRALMEILEASGVTIASAQQSIRAGLADIEVAASLEIAVGDPVLFVERLIRDDQNDPLEFVQSWYRGDLYEYRVMFERGGGVDPVSSAG